jgi:hypothetical protein
MPLVFGAQGVTPSLRGQPTTVLSLSAGQVELIPAGAWGVGVGLYSAVQEFDPVTGIWRNIGNDSGSTFKFVQSDGVNFRVANQTGCVVGVLVTTAGAGYTSAPVVSDNGGTATYQAIVGGAVNTSPTIANGGKNYVYPPQILISTPAGPGVQATATCTISAGAVNAITIVNQGAGYTSAPTFSIINDPRDTTGTGAVITGTLTGAGTITAVLVTNHGAPVTTVPTLTFTGGGYTTIAAGTAIMCWTITAMTVTSAGSGYSGNVLVTALGGFPSTAPSYVNTYIQSLLVRQRPAYIGAGLTSGAISTAGNTIYDGGIFPGTPTGYVGGFATGSAAQPGFTMGGVTDTVLLIAA